MSGIQRAFSIGYVIWNVSLNLGHLCLVMFFVFFLKNFSVFRLCAYDIEDYLVDD